MHGVSRIHQQLLELQSTATQASAVQSDAVVGCCKDASPSLFVIDPEPSTGSKRRSPLELPSQPAAKKGRLLKQSSSCVKDEPMTAAADANSMDVAVSPATKSRNQLVDSDDDDEDFMPGALSRSQGARGSIAYCATQLIQQGTQRRFEDICFMGTQHTQHT